MIVPSIIAEQSITRMIPQALSLTELPGCIGWIALTSFQCLVIATSYKQEQIAPSPYSKFADEKEAKDVMIGSRDGMLIIYTPALIVGAMLALSSIAKGATVSLATCMLIAHFAKRVLEVLFLHVYSGQIGRGQSTFIGVYYALTTLLIGSVANLHAAPTTGELTVAVSTALFVIGSLGNLYHHNILASLRRSGGSKEKKYVAPSGGLFRYVAAPHYFFELIAWLGIAFAAGDLNAFLVFASMSSYLAGRAVSQNQWNKNMFPKDWSAEKKSLVPFVL